MKCRSSKNTRSRKPRLAGLLALMLAGSSAAASESELQARIVEHLDAEEIRSAADAAAAETRAQIAADLATRLLGERAAQQKVAAARGKPRG